MTNIFIYINVTKQLLCTVKSIKICHKYHYLPARRQEGPLTNPPPHFSGSSPLMVDSLVSLI